MELRAGLCTGHVELPFLPHQLWQITSHSTGLDALVPVTENCNPAQKVILYIFLLPTLW